MHGEPDWYAPLSRRGTAPIVEACSLAWFPDAMSFEEITLGTDAGGAPAGAVPLLDQAG